MKKLRTATLSTMAIGTMIFASYALATPTINARQIERNTGLNSKIVNLAIKGYHFAQEKGDVHNPNYLTIVDFDLPSTAKRLWVINLNDNQVVFHTLVGQGHDGNRLIPTRFSNRPHSHESSLGVFTTGVTYYGSIGFSMHVHGLENGINSNAYRRDIEMHGAWYVSQNFVNHYGYLGRTWGCFGLPKQDIHPIANTIKDGSVLFAYANQENHDPYLT